jgi:hypothetical protein
MGGGVIGLLAGGVLADAFDSFGPTMALLAIGPMLMAILVFKRFPETAHRELEDINPADLVPEAPDDTAGAADRRPTQG